MNTPRKQIFFWALILTATALTAAAQTADYSAFKLITERNIFNPNRLPHSRFNTVRSSSVQRVTDSLSLVGTMSYEKGDLAFFDGTSAEFRKAVKPGETVAGLTLSAVGTNYVKVFQGTNEARLPIGTQLRRDNDGNWAIPDSAYTVSRRNSGWQRDYGTNRPPAEIASDSGTNTPPPNHNPPDAGADNSSPDSVVVIEQPTDSSQSTDTTQPATDAAPAPAGNPNDPLTRLMQQRAQEEQQLQRQ